jgi:redox-sensitive bicupin YhaK (pirin superfamily)
MRDIAAIYEAPSRHWVGDGFPVRSLFSHHSHGEAVSPFLLLDHAGPAEFPPATMQRGVGGHPHRGFETVTIVYDGEVAHRDSAGNRGSIGPGDVQWMTAGSGVLHEELHSEAFTRAGGVLEMAQLWVNLPAAHKNVAPAYQTLRAADIPVVELPGGGSLRVIAGAYGDAKGPARTFTPVSVIDVALKAGETATVGIEEGHTALLAALRGETRVNGAASVRSGQLVAFARAGGAIELTAGASEARLLLLSGEPIEEPVVMQGPFAMNSMAEIRQAMTDFRAGRYGELAA